MDINSSSPNRNGDETGPGRTARAVCVSGILLVALGARVFHAYGLPLNYDESEHLRVARGISVNPSSFNLPLRTGLKGHPPGVVYLTALADWAGGGNVFVIRLVFVGLSMLGLVGVFVLGFSMFGPRVALLALALAAVDRSLVALSPVFLEYSSVTCLVPWTILSMHRCLARGLARDWVFAGLLIGLGYWLSTIFLIMLLAFALCILLTGRGQMRKSRRLYVGLAVMLAIILPTIIGDLASGWMNLQRNLTKIGSFGLSPRMAILYIGDLLIWLKDPTWIVHKCAFEMYLPIYVPCDWVMGLGYMALTAVSLRYWRDERIRLLLLVLLGFLLPLTLLNARESWNHFTAASSTAFAVIVLCAAALDRTLTRMWGNITFAALLVYSGVALLVFLNGPTWGYYSPGWEHRYVGQVLAIQLRSDYDPSDLDNTRASAEIRILTRQALAQHPDSAVAWYFDACYITAPSKQKESLDRALELAPNNPLFVMRQASVLTKAGDWDGARELLQGLLAEHGGAGDVHAALAEVEYELGNLASAAEHVRRGLALRPLAFEPYGFLFDIYDAMGEEAKADAALETYLARHPDGPVAAFRQLARKFQRRATRPRQAADDGREWRDFRLAYALATRACQLTEWKEPECQSTLAMVHRTFAAALADRGDFELAIDNYHKAVMTDPRDALSLFDLASLLATCPDQRLRQPVAAIRLAEQGCELTNHADPIGLMALATAYAEAGHIQTAIRQFHVALQLARSEGNLGLVAELQRRLKRYQNGTAPKSIPLPAVDYTSPKR